MTITCSWYLFLLSVNFRLKMFGSLLRISECLVLGRYTPIPYAAFYPSLFHSFTKLYFFGMSQYRFSSKMKGDLGLKLNLKRWEITLLLLGDVFMTVMHIPASLQFCQIVLRVNGTISISPDSTRQETMVRFTCAVYLHLSFFM